MDGMVIPLPLQILAVVVLAGGVFATWRARGDREKVKWIAMMVLTLGIVASGLTMLLVGW